MSKFKIGDTVKIVNYGSIAWIHFDMAKFYTNAKILEKYDGGHLKIDASPEKIGMIDIITEIKKDGSIGLKKSAWYNENQLQLVNKDEKIIYINNIIDKTNKTISQIYKCISALKERTKNE